MKLRKREVVYRLFHTFDLEDTPKIYFRTKLVDEELVMLIKVWMYKLEEEEHASDFGSEFMMELLEQFGCRRIDPDTDNFRSYYEANMYEIWEATNINSNEEDMNNPKYYNEKSHEIMLKAASEYRKWTGKHE